MTLHTLFLIFAFTFSIRAMEFDLAEYITDLLCTVLSQAKDAPYIGEQVSQFNHALQAATMAVDEGQSPQLIMAALFHDIGHIVAPKEDDMDGYGRKKHELFGAEFLRQFGVPLRVCDLVAQHVNAKRYLVYKNPEYVLSDASKITLEFQGGPMSAEEAELFEKQDYFEEVLLLRSYDERAKIAGAKTLELVQLREYILQVLCEKILRKKAK